MHLENLFLNPAYLAAFLFGLKISAVFNMDCEFQYHYSLFKQVLSLELQVYSYRSNIGQDQLNICNLLIYVNYVRIN